MAKTSIEWSDQVLNFIEARKDASTCDPVSAGCRSCFAQVFAKRLKGVEKSKGQTDGLYHTNNETIKVNFEVLDRRLKELPSKPQRVFLESMSDLFHKEIPIGDIARVMNFCSSYPQHTFLILTKRYERLQSFIERYTEYYDEIPENIKFGVSICDNKDLQMFLDYGSNDIDYKFFVSFEPLLEKLNIGYSWGETFLDEVMENLVNHVIVGAETGNRKRPFEEEWALDILEVARKYNIPFFFKKQYKDGEWTNKLDGKEYLEFPKED